MKSVVFVKSSFNLLLTLSYNSEIHSEIARPHTKLTPQRGSLLTTAGEVLGSFRIDDGNGSENVIFKMNSRFLNFVAFIPIC